MKVKIKKEYLFSTWRAVIRSHVFLTFNILNLLMVIGLFGLLYYMFGHGGEEFVVLHYNIYFGIDLVGEWYRVFNIAYLGLTIFLVNFILGGLVYLKEKIVANFLTLGTFFCLGLLSVASLLIVLINS